MMLLHAAPLAPLTGVAPHILYGPAASLCSDSTSTSYANMLVLFIPSSATPHGCTPHCLAVLHGPLWLLPLSSVATHAFHTFSSSVVNHNTKGKMGSCKLAPPSTAPLMLHAPLRTLFNRPLLSPPFNLN